MRVRAGNIDQGQPRLRLGHGQAGRQGHPLSMILLVKQEM